MTDTIKGKRSSRATVVGKGGRPCERLQDQWGDWLDEFEWDHVCTVTFRAKVGKEAAVKAVQNWLRFLDRIAQCPVRHFVVMEAGSVGGRTHFHGLVRGTKGLKGRALARSWRHGRSKIEKYIRGAGGTHYVAKDLSRSDSEIIVSRKLERGTRSTTKGVLDAAHG